jgi:5-methylphenazine-1-carboxylate 1-monooxygenase
MPDVMIAGAGIGGLTAALALHRIGIRPRIFESVPELRPLGVGINLLPHATRVLGECGLLAPLADTAIETKELICFNKLGQKISSEPRGRDAGYAWPQLSVIAATWRTSRSATSASPASTRER